MLMCTLRTDSLKCPALCEHKETQPKFPEAKMINNVGMETLIKSGSLGILVSLQRRRFRRCIASARLGSGAGGGGGGGGGAAAGGAAAAGGDAAGGAAEEKKATGS